MKNLKKTLAVFLTLCLLMLMFSACGAEKVSNLTLEELKTKAISNEEDRENLIVTESTDGFVFSYSDEFVGYAETKLEGTADKKQNVKDFTYSQTHVNVDKLKSIDSTEFIALASKGDFSDMPLGELISVSFYVTCFSFVSSFVDEKADSILNIVNYLLDSVNTDMKINGWKFNIQIDEDESIAIFTASFIGE